MIISISLLYHPDIYEFIQVSSFYFYQLLCTSRKTASFRVSVNFKCIQPHRLLWIYACCGLACFDPHLFTIHESCIGIAYSLLLLPCCSTKTAAVQNQQQHQQLLWLSLTNAPAEGAHVSLIIDGVLLLWPVTFDSTRKRFGCEAFGKH